MSEQAASRKEVTALQEARTELNKELDLRVGRIPNQLALLELECGTEGDVNVIQKPGNTRRNEKILNKTKSPIETPLKARTLVETPNKVLNQKRIQTSG